MEILFLCVVIFLFLSAIFELPELTEPAAIATAMMSGKNCRSGTAPDNNNIPADYTEKHIEEITATCNAIICNALECVISNDATEACKNHRHATRSLCQLHKKLKSVTGKENMTRTYLTYMIEATEKIAETSRHIATTPGNTTTALSHNDIQILCKNLCEKPNADDNIANALANKERLERMIAIHTKTMNYEDFNEGSPVYYGLILLYYLHSFINSYYRVISTSSQSPRRL